MKTAWEVQCDNLVREWFAQREEIARLKAEIARMAKPSRLRGYQLRKLPGADPAEGGE